MPARGGAQDSGRHGACYDADLYAGLAELGVLGAAIPEAYGGIGLGHLELCVVAEELGRVLAPVPVASSIYLAAECLVQAGTEDQKSTWLPHCRGTAIGCWAISEGTGRMRPSSPHDVRRRQTERHERRPLRTARSPISPSSLPRKAAACRSASSTCPAQGNRKPGSVDPTRGQARISFDGAAATRIGGAGDGWHIATQVMDRAAILMGFEQLGGADRALEMARDYAVERMAFGRQIGSFQGVKHMLADMYVSATLAGRTAGSAWALATSAAELPIAAAAVRVSATNAFQHCAKNNIQTHGSMGFTWEFDCHSITAAPTRSRWRWDRCRHGKAC